MRRSAICWFSGAAESATRTKPTLRSAPPTAALTGRVKATSSPTRKAGEKPREVWAEIASSAVPRAVREARRGDREVVAQHDDVGEGRLVPAGVHLRADEIVAVLREGPGELGRVDARVGLAPLEHRSLEGPAHLAVHEEGGDAPRRQERERDRGEQRPLHSERGDLLDHRRPARVGRASGPRCYRRGGREATPAAGAPTA